MSSLDPSLLNRLRVLYVEDEIPLAQMMRQALGDYFALFELAKDGQEGLEMFRRGGHDLVITDITMPVMDGLQMAEAIHADSPDTPIVVLSAYSDKEKLLGAIDAGIMKYFIKPFDPEELLEYLRELAPRLVSRQRVAIDPDFLYDRHARILYRGQSPLSLSRREIRFVEALLDAPGHLLSPEAIKELLWGAEGASDDAVRVFMNRLRNKVGREFVRNRSGEGYYLSVRI